MTVFQSIQAGTIPDRLTVAQLYALTEAGVLAENENVELIDGQIVPMAVAKASRHEVMKSRFVRILARRLPDEVRVFVEPSVTLAPETLVEPDLVVWRTGGLPREVRGPDLLVVVEISDSSIGYDLRVKAPLYAHHDVPEYWVVDAVRETIRVHRNPDGGRYQDVHEYGAHEAVAPLYFPDLMIRIDALD